MLLSRQEIQRRKYAYTSHTSQGGFGQFDIKGGIIWFAVENIKFVFFVVITWNKGKEGLKTTYSGSCKKSMPWLLSVLMLSQRKFSCVSSEILAIAPNTIRSIFGTWHGWGANLLFEQLARSGHKETLFEARGGSRLWDARLISEEHAILVVPLIYFWI